MSRPTCVLIPFLRASCVKPLPSRKWRVRRTRQDVPTLPGRLCWDCATAVEKSSNGSYEIRAAIATTPL